MGNFYSANHPNAVFVNNFVISLISEDTTLSLRNKQFHRINEESTQTIEIKDSILLHSIINNDFKIPLDKEKCNILFNHINKDNRC